MKTLLVEILNQIIILSTYISISYDLIGYAESYLYPQSSTYVSLVVTGVDELFLLMFGSTTTAILNEVLV